LGQATAKSAAAPIHAQALSKFLVIDVASDVLNIAVQIAEAPESVLARKGTHAKVAAVKVSSQPHTATSLPVPCREAMTARHAWLITR
jgi:hypothetical protein